jgi:uncharacterized membrane protein YfcA
MGILASPILALIDPRLVPAPVLLSTLVLTSLLTIRDRHAIDFGGLRWAVTGRVMGTFVAATVLVSLPEDQMVFLFGGLVLLGVGMSVSGLRVLPFRSSLLIAGALSGLMGTVASIGGPPMALLYQDARGDRLRGTMSGFFWIGTIVSLVALRLIGRFGAEEISLALVMLPGVLIGFFVSRRTTAFIDRGYTRYAVLTVAGVTGVMVVLRQLI